MISLPFPSTSCCSLPSLDFFLCYLPAFSDSKPCLTFAGKTAVPNLAVLCGSIWCVHACERLLVRMYEHTCVNSSEHVSSENFGSPSPCKGSEGIGPSVCAHIRECVCLSVCAVVVCMRVCVCVRCCVFCVCACVSVFVSVCE